MTNKELIVKIKHIGRDKDGDLFKFIKDNEKYSIENLLKGE